MKGTYQGGEENLSSGWGVALSGGIGGRLIGWMGNTIIIGDEGVSGGIKRDLSYGLGVYFLSGRIEDAISGKNGIVP